MYVRPQSLSLRVGAYPRSQILDLQRPNILAYLVRYKENSFIALTEGDSDIKFFSRREGQNNLKNLYLAVFLPVKYFLVRTEPTHEWQLALT